MKKLLLLFVALLTGISGAWATTIAWEGSTGTQKLHLHGFGLSIPDDGTTDGKVYSFSSFSLGLRGDSNVQPYYMAICTQKKYPSSDFPYPVSDVIAVSNNAPTANYDGRFEYMFDSPVKLAKGVVYYVQFFTSNTPTDGVYTAMRQGLYVGSGDYPNLLYSHNATFTNYIPNFTATLTEESTSEVEPWVCVNAVSLNQIAALKLKASTPSTHNYYRLSAFNLYLCNKNITSGQDQNYLLISDKEDAKSNLSSSDVLGISQNNPAANGDNYATGFIFENVRLEGNKTYYLYFTANNAPSEGVYTLALEKIKLSATTGDIKNVYYSGQWQNWDFRYHATLAVLKTVTFSQAVSVNGGDPVSTIYVATDGSDSFSLPVNYKYTFGGKDYNIAAEAAAAIAAAGDEDINVTVTELSSYPITMNSDNTHAYATAYLPFPIRMQTGVKAYKAVSTGTNTLILSKVADAANTADDGDILAAGTAAILWKEGATSSASLSFDVVSSSKAAPNDNLLGGTYEDASVPSGKNAYVLYGGANGVGFYPLDGDDLPLYKAYYLEDAGSPVKSFSFSFNDIADGIQKAELDERLSQGQVYDLNGRRIEKPLRGIYIQNGRKFIIK